MKLITRDRVLLGVPQRWHEQYKYPKYRGTDKDDIYKNLLVLFASGKYTKLQIDETIGNDSWTRLECYECGKDGDALVHLGEDPDYESKTFYLCAKCLAKASRLMERRPK